MGSAVAVDTHTLIWYLDDVGRLSASALQSLDDATAAGEPIYLSAISLIEITYLIERGRILPAFADRLRDVLDDQETAFTVVPVHRTVAEHLATIPRPAIPEMPDRIIAATALFLGAPLVTRDQKIQTAGVVTTVW